MEKLLLAVIGAFDRDGNPIGVIERGMCIPLAATECIQEIIEFLGEDEVPMWLGYNGISKAPTGGLWVIEFSIHDDPSSLGNKYVISDHVFRQPTSVEVDGLLKRSRMRLSRKDPEYQSLSDKDWTFLGALV